MLETSTIEPFVPRRLISSAAARASSTGASKFAAKEACRAGPSSSAAFTRAGSPVSATRPYSSPFISTASVR